MNRIFPKMTLLKLLGLVACFGIVFALWFAPIRFTFELPPDARTSAQIGDLIDIQNSKFEVIVSQAKIVEYQRLNSDGKKSDVVTVRTNLFNRLRLSFVNGYTAKYTDVNVSSADAKN